MEEAPDREMDSEPGVVTDRFLRAIASRARLPDHVPPATAAAVTLCTLAARLTPGQAHLLLGAFPGPIQPLFERCIAHRYGPVEDLDDAGFLERIADRLDVTPAHAELICDSVFQVVRALLASEVIDHVAIQLPRDLRDLWRGTRTASPAPPLQRSSREALLAEIAARAPLPPGISAQDAFSVVVCIFSQRLSGGEARDVFLGLPEAVRPLLARCIIYRDEHGKVFDRAQLLSIVAEELGTTSSRAEPIVASVLAAIKRVLPAKEALDVASQLPPDLRRLWVSA